ncbi:stage II sporulation protein P [Niallia sp. MER 6]|uniref:stage II sporulation protein P n=1 Tax=Niallia sp. MER 6 TaxID=2939567 RepID=UPI00203CC85D|nr:stage II sporulation protein P [Niallia sp. MER 6]MCM3034251.1 stage II sporulation protein P [Niallia sp. MER 6]
MQDDRELTDLIKKSFSLNPREEFVLETENLLREKARRLGRKKTYSRWIISVSALIACLFVFTYVIQKGEEPLINLSNSTPNIENTISSFSNYSKEPLVYIYHTHNDESFIPELKAVNPNEQFDQENSYDENINITLVGQRLSKALNNRLINNIVDTTNNMKLVEQRGLSRKDAYNVSREKLVETLTRYNNIQMVFDLHRDTTLKRNTTVEINGKSYSKLAFVVNQEDEKYKENMEFAREFHEKAQELYPGLSRGIFGKSTEMASDYNQDILNQSVIIEIGGIENSLEEGYNTVEALAEIIEILLKEKK